MPTCFLEGIDHVATATISSDFLDMQATDMEHVDHYSSKMIRGNSRNFNGVDEPREMGIYTAEIWFWLPN